jgi:hypothetical protein
MTDFPMLSFEPLGALHATYVSLIHREAEQLDEALTMSELVPSRAAGEVPQRNPKPWTVI